MNPHTVRPDPGSSGLMALRRGAEGIFFCSYGRKGLRQLSPKEWRSQPFAQQPRLAAREMPRLFARGRWRKDCRSAGRGPANYIDKVLRSARRPRQAVRRRKGMAREIVEAGRKRHPCRRREPAEREAVPDLGCCSLDQARADRLAGREGDEWGVARSSRSSPPNVVERSISTDSRPCSRAAEQCRAPRSRAGGAAK